ncbi:winged helix-turn-helix transcriptional regulator [Candidatus Chloroploca sp. M-50]|uniref:Winged helix-turn-helix transcriptional regulator n=1 Tax=Candidatus Chloroploca mongolica TaxID=2528176 RepID=A0ABS4DFQ6_9CHLR|nr:metalloregulator ArsR/SmtB family transcription factor [Candidatus Chloroploca mongolica]MBP1468255.1 winged helix-turn-helix transcriptional regulator [Candidatus Chloroploca mongolica]
MNNATAERHAHIFKALMHPVRLQILDLLRSDEQCVCHLEAQLGQRQAYVSQQLAVLRKAGLISDRRDGLNSYYRIAHPEVLTMLDTVRAIIGGDESPETSLAIDCPCPRCSPVREPMLFKKAHAKARRREGLRTYAKNVAP